MTCSVCGAGGADSYALSLAFPLEADCFEDDLCPDCVDWADKIWAEEYQVEDTIVDRFCFTCRKIQPHSINSELTGELYCRECFSTREPDLYPEDQPD